MAYCRPASQFCCGCSVLHGIKFILMLHFAINAFLIVEAIGLIFVPNGAWMGSESMGVEVVVAGFALAGLPLIAAAFWGVLSKSEALIRVYLFYLVCSFIFDSYFILRIFILSGPCESMPQILRDTGMAFACGVARIVNGSAVTTFWGLQLYMIYIVWSYVEDMAAGGGPDLSDLVVDEDTFMLKRAHHEDPFASMVGLGEHVPAEYGSIYDAAADGGIGGSARIFNGNRHEMSYPPPRGLMKVC